MARSSATRRVLVVGALGIAAMAGCGSDDDAADDTPETATDTDADTEVTSAYTRAIMDSDSHDEILLPGGDMVVAVACPGEGGGGAIVTVVAVGLEAGQYVGSFEPSTGVDLSLQVSGPGEAVGASQMSLDDAEYTVTFDGIEGGEFDLRGC